ncbi:hypothetical protein JVT61DRAFT_11149 [Boletus reticuloceps]|uniref:Uncharacterized protein n=1 Tax=Boletus reticuloceps TaxID=495285 RepID=A0A8I2YEZ2_9AGAM|nr:hypothetical protein JVT61DRAFT_11149 [Boletus reticuloceps]
MARTRSINGKRVRPKLTKSQRDERRKRHIALATDLVTARQSFTQHAVDLATKHGRTPKWTRTQLFLNSAMRDRRRVNAWNAFLKEKLGEINSGHEKGNHVKLPTFVATHKVELLAEYRKLTNVQRQSLIAKVQAACESKPLRARANPKAINQAITGAFVKMDQEWTALCTKTGMEGFFIAVRGTVEDHAEPKIFFSEKAESFVRTVLDVEPRRLALRLESWVVSGISKYFFTCSFLLTRQPYISDLPATSNRQRPLNHVISDCCSLIQEGLNDILIECCGVTKNVKMNYTNYELHIVERHGVTLIGWPVSGRVRNPAKIGGRQEVEKLLTAVQAEKCKWVKLSAEELKARIVKNKALQAAGENIYQPRRVRSGKSKAAVDTDSSEDE